jgi:gamma-glutamyl-gamma-aminobutyrate hydrolase PuuD
VKTDGDAFDEYVLDVNKEFMELQGSVPVHISYLSDTDEDNAMFYSMLE